MRLNLIQSEAPTTDPAMVGRIVATEPPPGTEVQGAADVVARVGVLQEEPPPPRNSTTTTTPPDND